MPKRTDIKSILIIGSGSIVIGQGCEFDYSGTQACKALREKSWRAAVEPMLRGGYDLARIDRARTQSFWPDKRPGSLKDGTVEDLIM